jgi:hypothetical protein
MGTDEAQRPHIPGGGGLRLGRLPRRVDCAWTAEQKFHADVYVFCLHTATNHDEYDPLDVSQWRFYIAPRSVVVARAGARMGLAALTRVAGEPVDYDSLRGSIQAATAASGV